MAAGLGFKTFTTGEVLTAADVNGYLMQGILVFANAAARSSAITSPQEGQYSFLKDTNALEYYDGAAWVGAPVGDITAVNAGTGITGGGASGSVTITNDMATTITAAGDLVVGTGNATYDNLPIGTTGQVLTADTTVSPYKVKWAAAASSTPTFAGCLLTNSVAQTVATGTNTLLTWDTERIDTDAYHSTSSNTGRITIPSGKAGKYLITCRSASQTSSSGYRTHYTTKNSLVVDYFQFPASNVDINGASSSTILDLAVGDYIEFYFRQNSGGNISVYGNNSDTGLSQFSAFLIGA